MNINDKQTLDGYNPTNGNKQTFNSDYGRKVWTETVTQVTDEQVLTSADNLAALIAQTRKDLEQ